MNNAFSGDGYADAVNDLDEKRERLRDELNEKVKEWGERLSVDEFNQPRSRQTIYAPYQPEQSPDELEPLEKFDASKLNALVRNTERWKGYMLNLGYEIHQLKQMLTMCEDAAIKVRRLVHNFKERMEQTEADVWDENHQLRPDFNFKGIAVAGLRDIILLHDWHAANAGEKTAQEMGMSEEGFKQFRRRCNTISYNLRKNQYAKLLAMEKVRIESLINDLEDKMKDRDRLHYPDKYGWEAKVEEEKPWSIEDVTQEQVDRIKPFMDADAEDEVI